MARKALEGTAAYICARQNGTVDMPADEPVADEPVEG